MIRHIVRTKEQRKIFHYNFTGNSKFSSKLETRVRLQFKMAGEIRGGFNFENCKRYSVFIYEFMNQNTRYLYTFVS